MGLLSTLAAHDLGYLGTERLAERIEDTLTTVEALERHEGHLLNWYDTTSLAPLAPRYVSTVDSGNLAGALMTLAAGLRERADATADRDATCAGLADTAGVLGEALTALSQHAHAATALRAQCSLAQVELTALRARLVEAAPAETRLEAARQSAAELRAALARVMTAVPGGPEAEEVAEWSRLLVEALEPAAEGAAGAAPLRERLLELAHRSDALANDMDWRFLYDSARGFFAIGYRLADAEGPGRLDPSYYDLLASEARLASFVAIARGEVPQEHWFRLSRALVERRRLHHAGVVERLDVRVPDAAAAHAQPPRDAARPDAAASCVRAQIDLRPARTACRGASRSRPTRAGLARQLPVPGVRRARRWGSSAGSPRTW